MTDHSFTLRIIDLHWIQNEDDPTDRCAHGHVFLKIGDEIVSDEHRDRWTLSATALYLLRSIETDYHKGDFGSQLLPCCGHMIIQDEKTGRVILLGCPNGIDWTILHEGDEIRHISENGKTAVISKSVYRQLVFAFADEVQQFYKNSLPKILPKDLSEKEAYLAFWEEWKKLREQ